MPFFISCADSADNTETFPTINYSHLVKSDSYKIDSSENVLTVLNLFVNEYGYGEHTVNGIAIHSENAILTGVPYKEEISCNINKIKVYHVDDSTNGMTISSFYVDFYNEKDEILSYIYKWQYTKTSDWCKSDAWYKNANEKSRTDWDITITR